MTPLTDRLAQYGLVPTRGLTGLKRHEAISRRIPTECQAGIFLLFLPAVVQERFKPRRILR